MTGWSGAWHSHDEAEREARAAWHDDLAERRMRERFGQGQSGRQISDDLNLALAWVTSRGREWGYIKDPVA